MDEAEGFIAVNHPAALIFFGEFRYFSSRAQNLSSRLTLLSDSSPSRFYPVITL